MRTTQDAFSSMRGHVADGCEIVMRNGDVLTLKSVIQGWQLFDQNNRPFNAPTNSAHVVECIVVAHPSEEI